MLNLKCLQDVQAEKGQYIGGWMEEAGAQRKGQEGRYKLIVSIQIKFKPQEMMYCLREWTIDSWKICEWPCVIFQSICGKFLNPLPFFFFSHFCCPQVGREASGRKSMVDWEGSVTSGQNNAILPSQIIYLLTDRWLFTIRDFFRFWNEKNLWKKSRATFSFTSTSVSICLSDALLRAGYDLVVTGVWENESIKPGA